MLWPVSSSGETHYNMASLNKQTTVCPPISTSHHKKHSDKKVPTENSQSVCLPISIIITMAVSRVTYDLTVLQLPSMACIDRYLMFYAQATAKGHYKQGETKCMATTRKFSIH